MALTGFDPSIVNQSISAVNKAYNELMKALVDDMQRDFVGGMSDKWACNNAQKFFNDAFKPAVDGLIDNANKIFQSVVEAMNSAGQAWAEQTNASFSPVSFTAVTKKMDVSGILENINGVRGIDLANANTVAGKLSIINTSAGQALQQAQQAVQNCGFMGGSQASNLISSLGSIKTKINSATTELTTQSKDAINKTVESYGNTGTKVEEAFKGE